MLIVTGQMVGKGTMGLVEVVGVSLVVLGRQQREIVREVVCGRMDGVILLV